MLEIKIKKRFMLAVIFLIFFLIAALLVLFLSVQTKGKDWLVFAGIAGPLFIITVSGLIEYFYTGIAVDDKRIVTRRWFGKTKEYLFEDIRYYKHNIMRRMIWIYFKGGKCICVTGFETNYEHFVNLIRQKATSRKATKFPLILDEEKAKGVDFAIKQRKRPLILCAFFALLDVALICVVIFSGVRDEAVAIVVMSCFVLAITVSVLIYVINILRFKIEIKANDIVITPTLGKKREYKLCNIADIADILDNPCICFDDGGKFKLNYVSKTNTDLFIDLFTEPAKTYYIENQAGIK